jgi:hypothetical protein
MPHHAVIFLNSMLLQLLFIAFLVTSAVMAQVPQAINYQAVARNNAGQALANQAIKVRISVMDNAVSIYSETRSVTTNPLGLFNVQIGSAGAIATTGSFTSIDWVHNTPNPKSIKIELDINNTNTFTDMGTRPLSAVPYALAAENTVKIGGSPISFAEPNTGDMLKFDGTAWQPVPAPTEPRIYSIATTIPQIASGGGGGAPWVMAGGYATVTVTAAETITANFTGVFGHGNNNPQPCSFSVCYEPVVNGVPTGVITSFQGNYYTDGTIAATGNKTALSATGARSFPAGTYRIFMGLKNKSANVNFGANDYVNGTVIVF